MIWKFLLGYVVASYLVFPFCISFEKALKDKQEDVDFKDVAMWVVSPFLLVLYVGNKSGLYVKKRISLRRAK